MSTSPKIALILQAYNEVSSGHLERFLTYNVPLVDFFIVYDDGSTDGTYERCVSATPHVIHGVKNDFEAESSHKNVLLQYAKKLGADFILWLDADEILTKCDRAMLDQLCRQCEVEQWDGLQLHNWNLWRSSTWKRTDTAFDSGWFTRLWRLKSDTAFMATERGLHHTGVPQTIKKLGRTQALAVIHYGFASLDYITNKFLTYRNHGQRGYDLRRLIDEKELRLQQIGIDFFPAGLWVEDESAPVPLSLNEIYDHAAAVEADIARPKYSIACLIYKSVEWLKFVYEQVLKYTDFQNTEFYFVVNDGHEHVIDYLRRNLIPHYVHENTAAQREEWYINNVYRAWNEAAAVATGDFVVFINSDMAFSPGWMENLKSSLSGSNVVTSRLVESGKLRSGLYGVEMDFGRRIPEYREKDFLLFSMLNQRNELKPKGLYMPLLIQKALFRSVGGFPEGNVKKGSDIFNPVIAQKTDPLLSGDDVFMQKLERRGFRHETAFNSIVYHFQCGEMDEQASSYKVRVDRKVIFILDADDLSSHTEKLISVAALMPNSETFTLDAKRPELNVSSLEALQRKYPRSVYVRIYREKMPDLRISHPTLFIAPDENLGASQESNGFDLAMRDSPEKIVVETESAYRKFLFQEPVWLAPDSPNWADRWRGLIQNQLLRVDLNYFSQLKHKNYSHFPGALERQLMAIERKTEILRSRWIGLKADYTLLQNETRRKAVRASVQNKIPTPVFSLASFSWRVLWRIQLFFRGPK